MKSIKVFWTILKAELQNSLIYPGMMLIWAFYLFATPTVMLFVWLNIIAANPALQPQKDAIVTYYVFVPLSSLLTSCWHAAFFSSSVKSGELSTFLIKPFNYFIKEISNNIAEKIIKSLFLVPIIAVAVLYLQPKITQDYSLLVYAAVSLVLGSILNFTFETIIGYLAFWLEDISGLLNFRSIMEYTLGGRFIPFFLFPPAIQAIAVLLPFRYFSAFPAEIISQALSKAEILQGIAVQLAWSTVFIVCAVVLWEKGKSAYSAVGG